jgi:uncharacterized protein YndB with AHSA1/START domain
MPRASRTLTIRRPVAEVYAFLTEPVNDPTWRREPPTDLEVIAREENQRFEFRQSVGLVRADGRMTFREVDGHTTLTLTLDAPLSGMAQYTQGRKVERALDSVLGDLDTARAHLENQGLPLGGLGDNEGLGG